MSNPVYSIAVFPGDGIGPEVIDAALTVLDKAAGLFDLNFEYQTLDAGAQVYRQSGQAIAEGDMEAAGRADAILLGAMGLPDVRQPDGTEIAPQIDLRERYQLFASLRPAKLFEGVSTKIKADHVDMLVIRETTEGLFAGRHDRVVQSDEMMSDRLTITRDTSERLFELAFEQALNRKKTHGTPGLVTLLDKSNILRSNAFLRKIFDEVAERHPKIETERLYIDAGSMMFVTNPERFDVVVTENVFGDITSEIAAGVVGGLGVVPSADVSREHGVFQPCHGSAPDITEAGKANPIATVMSVVIMLEWLGTRNRDPQLLHAAAAIQQGIGATIASGVVTPDIGGKATTSQVTDAITAAIISVAYEAN